MESSNPGDNDKETEKLLEVLDGELKKKKADWNTNLAVLLRVFERKVQDNGEELTFAAAGMLMEKFSQVISKQVDQIGKDMVALNFQLCDKLTPVRAPEVQLDIVLNHERKKRERARRNTNLEQQLSEIPSTSTADLQQPSTSQNTIDLHQPSTSTSTIDFPQPSTSSAVDPPQPVQPLEQLTVRRTSKTKERVPVPAVPDPDKSDDEPEPKRKAIVEDPNETTISVALPGKKVKLPAKKIDKEKIKELENLNWKVNLEDNDSSNELPENHPLFGIFEDIGSVAATAKKTFTLETVSLPGSSWNTLFMMEKSLKRKNVPDTPTFNDSGYDSYPQNESEGLLSPIHVPDVNIIGSPDHQFCDNTENQPIEPELTTETSKTGQELNTNTPETDSELNTPTTEAIKDTTASELNNNVGQNSLDMVPYKGDSKIHNEVRVLLQPLSKDTINKLMLRKHNFIKELKVNLFQFPLAVLMKKTAFILPPIEFFGSVKMENKLDLKTNSKRKREDKHELAILNRRRKVIDSVEFEKFCYKFYVDNGIIQAEDKPQPLDEPDKSKVSGGGDDEVGSSDESAEKVPLLTPGIVPSLITEEERHRKSVDVRSEISYDGFCPVTPDSGMFSLSTINTDSEFELNDELELERHPTSEEHRIDSGLSMHCELNDKNTNRTSQCADTPETNLQTDDDNPVFEALKKIFPTVCSDRETYNVIMKTIDPVDVERTIQYRKWEQFIKNKISNSTDFNIHEYGDDIIKQFPTQTVGEEMKFSGFIQHKNIQSTEEISRYFVSCLQLVNEKSINVLPKEEISVDPDNISFQFLSKERQHDKMSLKENPEKDNRRDNPNELSDTEDMFVRQLKSREHELLLQSTPTDGSGPSTSSGRVTKKASRRLNYRK